MKKGLYILLTAIALVVVLQFNPSCMQTQKVDGTITAVLPCNAKYVYIMYKNEETGTTYQEQVFHGQVKTDGTTTVDPHDYIPQYCKTECKPYGNL